MDYEKYNKYLQERWDGMIEILEAKNKKNVLVDKYNKFVYKNAHKAVTKHLKKVREKHGTNMSPKKLKSIFEDLDKYTVKTINKESTMKKRTVNQNELVIKATYTFEPFNTDKLVQQLWFKVNMAASKGYLWEYAIGGFDDNNKVTIELSIKK